MEFKETHGHCRVPMSIPDLGKWAKYQRDQYCMFLRGKKAKISQEKVDKLTSIGFEESLEERVALGLEDGGGLTAAEEQQVQHENHPLHPAQHHQLVQQHHPEQVLVEHHTYQHLAQPQQQHDVAQAMVEGVQQPYAEHYHHGDAGAADHDYTGQTTQQPEQQQGDFQYQHGSVHYHG